MPAVRSASSPQEIRSAVKPAQGVIRMRDVETALVNPVPKISLPAGGVEVGATLAVGAVVGSVAAKVFPDATAVFASGIVVVDGDGAIRLHLFG